MGRITGIKIQGKLTLNINSEVDPDKLASILSMCGHSSPESYNSSDKNSPLEQPSSTSLPSHYGLEEQRQMLDRVQSPNYYPQNRTPLSARIMDSPKSYKKPPQ